MSPQVTQLDPADFILDYGELGNFSVAGFEMQLRRHVSHYLITYYLPSGDYDYDFYYSSVTHVYQTIHCHSQFWSLLYLEGSVFMHIIMYDDSTVSTQSRGGI